MERAIMNNEGKSPFYCFIRGTSMLPFLRGGMIVEIEKRQMLDIGDIAVYKWENGYFGHRVIRISHSPVTLYEIKGDTIEKSDGWFTQKEIIGVVTGILVSNKTCGIQSSAMRQFQRVIAFCSRTHLLRYVPVVHLISFAYRLILRQNET